MNWLKQKILGLLRAELAAAYDMLSEERKNANICLEANKALAQEVERLKMTNDLLIPCAEHWRQDANAMDKLFCDIIKEIEGAEDLHNLRQVVRIMAYRAENSAIIVQGSGEDPNPAEEPTEVV